MYTLNIYDGEEVKSGVVTVSDIGIEPILLVAAAYTDKYGKVSVNKDNGTRLEMFADGKQDSEAFELTQGCFDPFLATEFNVNDRGRSFTTTGNRTTTIYSQLTSLIGTSEKAARLYMSYVECWLNGTSVEFDGCTISPALLKEGHEVN